MFLALPADGPWRPGEYLPEEQLYFTLSSSLRAVNVATGEALEQGSRRRGQTDDGPLKSIQASDRAHAALVKVGNDVYVFEGTLQLRPHKDVADGGTHMLTYVMEDHDQKRKAQVRTPLVGRWAWG